jgi:hypothetical protein
VQLALAGAPLQKPKYAVVSDTVGLELGPASIGIVPRQAAFPLQQGEGGSVEALPRTPCLSRGSLQVPQLHLCP